VNKTINNIKFQKTHKKQKILKKTIKNFFLSHQRNEAKRNKIETKCLFKSKVSYNKKATKHFIRFEFQ